MSARLHLQSLAGLGVFLLLAAGSLPSEEEMAASRAEKEATWALAKAQLAQVHASVSAVDIGAMSAVPCDAEAMGANLPPELIKREYGTVDLNHAELSFLARFASDDPAAFTKDRGPFYWLTDGVLFTRLDDLKSDGTQPAESDWERVVTEMQEKRYLVVFVVDEAAPNVEPVVRSEDDVDWGELHAAAFVVDLETADIACQGRFHATNGDEIEWVDGAVLTDGSAIEALESDFEDQVNAAVGPLVAKPLGLDVNVWR